MLERRFTLLDRFARRAERTLQKFLSGSPNESQELIHAKQQHGTIQAYLNRLGDWLFVLARRVNQLAEYEETKWIPTRPS